MKLPWNRLAAFALFAASSLSLAQGQSLISTFTGESLADDEFGKSVAGAGDLDGDGVPDFLVGARGYNTGYPGSVRAISGANGAVLHTTVKESNGTTSEFGWALASLDDVNGDGVRDFAVGAPSTAGDDRGLVEICSGVNGSLLHSIPAVYSSEHFGHTLAAIGDVDGDGISDLVAGGPDANVPLVGNQAGVVRVVSGATGNVVHEILGSSLLEHLGYQVVAMGDVNGDGWPDFAASAWAADVGVQDGGAVFVYSGLNASVLYTIPGTTASQFLGFTVVGVGDLNGDSVSELGIRLPQNDIGVFSGIDGSYMFRFPFTEGPVSLAPADDVDQDGTRDILVGVYHAVETRSGVDGALVQSFAGNWSTTIVGAIGDVTGDGTNDFLVGAPSEYPYGKVELYAAEMYTEPGTVLCAGDGSAVPCPCSGGHVWRTSFSSGALSAGWTATGNWHVSPGGCQDCGNSDPYAYFGIDATCDYYGAATHNSLITPPIQLPSALDGRLMLSFCQKITMDPEGNRAWVYVSGASETLSFYSGNSVAIPYEPQPYDITALSGQSIQIEFYFYNDWIGYSGGWGVDDILIRWEPNNGEPGTGCLNSTLQGGVLGAIGTNSVVNDDLVLSATHLPPNVNGIVFVGLSSFAPGIPLGAGLVCAGGISHRYPASNSGLLGTISVANPVGQANTLLTAGTTAYFQAWYRDSVQTGPCQEPSNLTNAYRVTFTP